MEKSGTKDKNIIRLLHPPAIGDVVEIPRRRHKQTIMCEGCRSYINASGKERHLVLWCDVDTDRLWISGLFAHNLIECGYDMERWITGLVDFEMPPENRTFVIKGPPKQSRWKVMTQEEIENEVERLTA